MRDDRRVVEACRCQRLALDPLARAALARDHLDRHLALEALVPGVPDDAEAAGAEPLLESVAVQHHAGTRTAGKRFR